MLQDYAESLRGKRVCFVGLGVSNLPILELLLPHGVRCSVRDKKDLLAERPELSSLRERGVAFRFGEGYLSDLTEDVIFLSPGVRQDLPEFLQAKANGAKLTSELEEFFRLCPCKRIGVTGSDGKTTTTTLIALLLRAAGKRVHLGGNIGENLFVQLDEIRPEDYVVAELSSFQLMKLTSSPEIALITNLSPNHLDWHRDMREYADAKANIFSHQDPSGLLVLNRDDPYAARYAEQAHGRVRWISGEEKLPNGEDVWFDETGVHRGEELLLPDGDILLVGRHNRYNYAEAIAAVGDLVPTDVLREVARTFGGVEHRIELVREKGGVKFYNSSIDSSPSRTAACLNSFEKPVVVICGGYDKHIPLAPLGPLFREKAKAAVLCGQTAEKIETALRDAGYTRFVRADSFEEAVRTAAQIAEPGDSVVLSPAAASFDQFRNFAERGETFRRIVKEL